MAGESKRSRRETALSADRIIEAALRISDAEGDIDRLTVRGIAADLGVGTMSLYSYFRSKDEILDGMADRVLGGMQFPDEPDAGPAEGLRTVAQAFLSTMREHPSVVRILATRLTSSPVALRGAMEAVLQRLVDAGIPGPLAVRSYGFLITYAIGFVSYQTPRPWGAATTDQTAELRRQRSHYYAGLPIDDFPHMVKFADLIVDVAGDEQYALGVEAFIASVLAEIENSG